jgi:hypothetical protein
VLFAFYAYLLIGRTPRLAAHATRLWSTAGVVIAAAVTIALWWREPAQVEAASCRHLSRPNHYSKAGGGRV